MIDAIVFSRDRPAQLDLLLRGLRKLKLFERVDVLFECSPESRFYLGYNKCIKEHSDVLFTRECGFRDQTRNLLRGTGEFVSFFCDDDVVVRSFPQKGDVLPEEVLQDEEILCVSLRLGLNTTQCYPLRSSQELPAFCTGEPKRWYWRDGKGDFGYPASLDGHVFRHEQALKLFGDEEFSDPNELESKLAARVGAIELPGKVACYSRSVICGVPVNRVGQTHSNNRYAEKEFLDVVDANQKFLAGQRLRLGSFRASDVDAAHVELPLVFE